MFIAIDAFTAFAADDVMVMPFFGMMIDEFVVYFAFEYAVQFLKHLECAIDRRFIDAGHLALNGTDDLFCGQVGIILVYDIHN